MAIKKPIIRSNMKTLIALGVFCGLGFMSGFFTGFGYARYEYREIIAAYDRPEPPMSEDLNLSASEDLKSSDEATSPDFELAEEDGTAMPNIELSLEKHELGSDENGTFITGTVANRSDHAFDAVQIQFELCDKDNVSYSTLTERYTERIESGDSWEFTIYIPYSDINSFASYKLHGLMGTTKK